MAEPICRCGHEKSAHFWHPGFYDVRGHHEECTVVGCPCQKYEWMGTEEVK